MRQNNTLCCKLGNVALVLRPAHIVYQGNLNYAFSQRPYIAESQAGIASEPSVTTPHSLVP